MRDSISVWRNLESRCRDLLELADLVAAEAATSLQAELEAEVSSLERQIAQAEIRLTLTGSYDDHPAIVTIQSGAGGAEAQDWPQMLLQMYAGWAARGRRPLENNGPVLRRTKAACAAPPWQ